MPSPRRIDDYLGRSRPPPPRSPGGDRETGQNAVCPEEAISRAAERAAEKVAAIYLSKLLEELDALRREVDALRKEVERLSRKGPSGKRQRLGGEKSGLAELLAKEGFVLGSEARAKLGYGPARLKAEAEDLGAVVIELDGDLAVVDKRAFEEFVAELSRVETSDPNEAAKALGKYGSLFNELRRSGRVYYDARRGYWRLL